MTAPAPVLWIGDNGQITCVAHAGGYLTSAIGARPRARTHRTPLGTWERVGAAEVAADPALWVCETCVPWSERPPVELSPMPERLVIL